MRHSSLKRPALALLMLAAMLATPLASAEIFKCIAKDGMPLYQNFPCQFDSMGWMPSKPQTATTALTALDARQTKPPAPAVRAAPVLSAVTATEARVGMSTDEVRAIWGDPMEMLPGETGTETAEIWRYDDGKAVHLDHTQRVVAVQK